MNNKQLKTEAFKEWATEDGYSLVTFEKTDSDIEVKMSKVYGDVRFTMPFFTSARILADVRSTLDLYLQVHDDFTALVGQCLLHGIKGYVNENTVIIEVWKNGGWKDVGF